MVGEPEAATNRRLKNFWEPFFDPELSEAFRRESWASHHHSGFVRCIFSHEENGHLGKSSGLSFDTCDFRGKFIRRAIFDSCKFVRCDFGTSSWINAKFANCEFDTCSFTQASL
jgi:uncharacterized protein YjbI with pentapeptide repeats